MNVDFSFWVKNKIVFDAAILSSILYGCESWFGVNLESLNSTYCTLIKVLLSVRLKLCSQRYQTPTCWSLVWPSLDAPVKAAQTEFASRLLCLRQYTLETIHSWKYTVLWSRDHGLETRVHSSSFSPGLGLGLKTACLVPTPVERLP